jgi:hypothetical protein
MRELGYIIDEKQKMKSYEKIFPADNGNIGAALELQESISGLRTSNLNVFLDHCVKEARKNSFNDNF